MKFFEEIEIEQRESLKNLSDNQLDILAQCDEALEVSDWIAGQLAERVEESGLLLELEDLGEMQAANQIGEAINE